MTADPQPGSRADLAHKAAHIYVGQRRNAMWPFKKKSADNFSAATQTAASTLVAATEEAAPQLLKALAVEGSAGNQELIVPLTLELMVFGLHLTDRIAFSRLGAESRGRFMNALLSAVQSELHPAIGAQLQQLYNTRNSFYGSFRKLYPDGEETLKGTLFWEFGKALGSIYANSNPSAITETSAFGMNFLQSINHAFDTQAVFP